ncbi:MerR family transcriptional regulator [Paraburkholderia sp. JHI869]|uniref:MerR family transcriptional regulator n=1 Tax=Paraburkholderia sp. JHI869 TaxID=3112959 RepID=UPI003177F480
MKIGELAQHTGLAASRIRFYEGIGLLKAERQPNGYRTYSPQAVLLLNLITTAQQAGFSLDEIRMFLPPDLTQWKHGSLIETLRGKVHDIEALEKRLAQSKAHLVELLAEIEANPENMDCTANAKRVLSRLRSGELKAPALEAADVTTLRKAKRRVPLKRA